MPQKLQAQPTRFINAEAGVFLFPQPADELGGVISIPSPVVILSFGAEDGPIEDRAVSPVEARQMVIDILSSLAQMGDALAQAVVNQYFGWKSTGTEFNEGGCDGCTDCE